VFGYRKKIVTKNLQRSFPEKTEQEIAKLRKEFYKYFADLILEIIKTLTISQRSMLKRCKLDEKSVLLMKQLYDEQKNIILVLGHQGNWEWGGNAFSLVCRQQLYVIYHPLENEYFDSLINKMRKRFGTKLIEMRNTYREMVSSKNEITATAFIADQTPPPESAYWTTFLNQDTPVFWGTEKIARKLNYPVYYMNIKRVKRGYYELSAELLCERPSETAEGEITKMHTKKLEDEIVRNPEIWLWSHRRWKHKRPI